MVLVKRAVIFFARPIYKGLVERPLWWFLAKVKNFFFAETMDRLTAIETRLAELENSRHLNDFNRIEAHNAAQWDALEQLLLALMSQPRALESDRDETGSVAQYALLRN